MTAGIHNSALDDKKIFYNLFLLLVAGLGGLLYGVDVGIIGGALPYLEATSASHGGSFRWSRPSCWAAISTLFAGMIADWMGRKPFMVLSGLTFVVSIPVIALSQGYGPWFSGGCCKASVADSSGSSSRYTWPSVSRASTAARVPASFNGCSRWASLLRR